MEIRQEVINEIKDEIDHFLNHYNVDEQQKQSLLKAPALLDMLNQLYIDSDLPLEQDLEVSSAVRYINSIYDFLPTDFSGPMGSLDDILVAALVLRKLNNTIDLSNYCDKKPNFDTISNDIIQLGRKYLPDYVNQRIKREFA
ncbi:MAG: hypothetical protein ACOCPM_03385 [Bacteroidales bacterium]